MDKYITNQYYKSVKILCVIASVLSVMGVIWVLISCPASEYFVKIQYEIRPLILMLICLILMKRSKKRANKLYK